MSTVSSCAHASQTLHEAATHTCTHTHSRTRTLRRAGSERSTRQCPGRAGRLGKLQSRLEYVSRCSRKNNSLFISLSTLSLTLSHSFYPFATLSLSNVLCMLSELSVSQNCSCFIAHSSSLAAAAANGASQLLFYPHIIFTTFLAYNKICACAQKSIITSQ